MGIEEILGEKREEILRIADMRTQAAVIRKLQELSESIKRLRAGPLQLARCFRSESALPNPGPRRGNARCAQLLCPLTALSSAFHSEMFSFR